MTKEKKLIRKSELLAEERALTTSQSLYLDENIKDDLFNKYEEMMWSKKAYKSFNSNSKAADVIGAMADRKNKIRSEMRILFPVRETPGYSTVFDCSYVR